MEQLQHDQTRQPAAPADERRDAAVGRRPRASVDFVAARVVAAALVTATGAIHLVLYRDGFSSVRTLGPRLLAGCGGGDRRHDRVSDRRGPGVPDRSRWVVSVTSAGGRLVPG
jgi:hypothetical protein